MSTSPKSCRPMRDARSSSKLKSPRLLEVDRRSRSSSPHRNQKKEEEASFLISNSTQRPSPQEPNMQRLRRGNADLDFSDLATCYFHYDFLKGLRVVCLLSPLLSRPECLCCPSWTSQLSGYGGGSRRGLKLRWGSGDLISSACVFPSMADLPPLRPSYRDQRVIGSGPRSISRHQPRIAGGRRQAAVLLTTECACLLDRATGY